MKNIVFLVMAMPACYYKDSIMPNFVPVLTTEPGSCLTSENWEEISVNNAAYDLAALLLKPGYNLLIKLAHLGDYLNWSQTLVINASHLKANREGIYTIISPYDGSRVKLDESSFFDLIQWLKPNKVLLPPMKMEKALQLITRWDEKIVPYFSAQALNQALYSQEKNYGVYFHCKNVDDLNPEALRQWADVSCYIVCEQVSRIKSNPHRIDYIQCDEPAKLGMQGLVFHDDTVIDLKSDSMAMAFEPIDQSCTCPTCQQQFTKAYLHHLYHNTPLLCQRFLIQHNVHHIQGLLTK